MKIDAEKNAVPRSEEAPPDLAPRPDSRIPTGGSSLLKTEILLTA
jgi:hypothetical protein